MLVTNAYEVASKKIVDIRCPQAGQKRIPSGGGVLFLLANPDSRRDLLKSTASWKV